MPRSSLDHLFDRWRRTGEPAALAEVFDRTAGQLFGMALHLARDAHEAEDLVQATYLAAIEDAASWDARRAFLPWLSGILANRARRLLTFPRRACRSRFAPAGRPSCA